MEALHILRFGRSTRDGEPPFLHAGHKDIGLCPAKDCVEHGALSLPFGNLGPQHVVELLTSRSGGDHTGERKTGKEPKKGHGLGRRFADALTGSHAHAPTIGIG